MNDSSQRRRRVLFLCRDNTTRSLIAEAILRGAAGRTFESNSAGVSPGPSLHALAAEVLEIHHVSTKALCPKDHRQFFGQYFDYVIALHDRSAENPPSFPGAQVLSWSFGDPLSDPDPTRAFEHLFLELNQRIRLLIIIAERFVTQRAA